MLSLLKAQVDLAAGFLSAGRPDVVIKASASPMRARSSKKRVAEDMVCVCLSFSPPLKAF
jgi:hypothetical protein